MDILLCFKIIIKGLDHNNACSTQIAVEWKLKYSKDIYDIDNNCNNTYNQSTESKTCI